MRENKHNTNTFAMKPAFLWVFILTIIIGSALTAMILNNPQNYDDSIKFIEKWTVTDSKGNSFETGRKYEDKPFRLKIPVVRR